MSVISLPPVPPPPLVVGSALHLALLRGAEALASGALAIPCRRPAAAPPRPEPPPAATTRRAAA
jgi:hypothetical protein